jgi:hypothetical protein
MTIPCDRSIYKQSLVVYPRVTDHGRPDGPRLGSGLAALRRDLDELNSGGAATLEARPLSSLARP